MRTESTGRSGPCPASLPSLASLRGVGSQTLKKLEKLGLHTVQDLLFHLPLRYEDRTRLTPIGHLRGGDTAQVEGRILDTDSTPQGRRSLIVRLSDGTGTLSLRFFHFTADQHRQFLPGRRLRCFGEIRAGFLGPEMAHPDWQFISEDEAGQTTASLTPVYPLTEGIHQKSLRRIISLGLDWMQQHPLPDWLPPTLIPEPAPLALGEALRLLHAPPAGHGENDPRLAAARQRLAYEELLAHHLSLGQLRARFQANRAPALPGNRGMHARFLRQLPFQLTAAQHRVIAEISADLALPRPMMRLVQGDVGSGKTVVAAHAALTALASGYQVAIMAPTELLAEQHAHSFRHWLEPMETRIVFLSGRARGEVRRQALADLASGEAGVIIGTHALFQETVSFHRLGLVIIDEQHRFGVHQRLALREKGANDGGYPHQLIMTATPIPRTLAMLGYADLDLSIIDERPPGRTPVKTAVIPVQRRDEIIDRIGEWVSRGRQVYWVCTLIEESEMLQAEAAEKSAERLQLARPELRIALIHGRLKPAEKETVMQSFKAGGIDVLVATTVIEVGVDVPNAGLMIIENPERLGLAQLHQLRGRVGRGPGEAHCILLYQPPLSGMARERLGILRDSDDGFVIAEKDMEIRGPGELLGTRQTGQVQFRIADLNRDAPLMEAVHVNAERLMRDYPAHIQPLIQRWLGDAVQYVEA